MFYQQVLCSFNECKPKNLENISLVKIVQQPIWNNCNFLYKGISFLKKKIGLHVEFFHDLLMMKEISSRFQTSKTMNNKSNWIFEFKTLSSVFKPLCRKFDFFKL